MPGMMSRAEMEQVIRSGGSVLHQGSVITRLELLPSEADLARGNPEQEAAVAEGLRAQLAELQAQLERLQAGGRGTQASGSPAQDAPPSGLGLTSVSRATEAALAEAGFASREALQAASDEQLLAVDGIGEATLKKLREELG